jgi:hypothetical protein
MKRSLGFSILIIGITILLAGCSNGASEITNSGRMTPLSGIEHDWGDINIRGGDVSHIFSFKNDSASEDLYLKGAKTSCMCTTARYSFSDGSVSPKFGMHDNSSTWSKAIKPGETFDVEVVFDPMAHGPGGTGPIQRTVDLLTSARPVPSGPVAQVGEEAPIALKASGLVLSKEDYEAKYSE